MHKRAIILLIIAILTIAIVPLCSVYAFTDVTADIPQSEAIDELTRLNVISGYPDGTFKPEGSVTRAEYVKMLMSLNNLKILPDENTLTGFSDIDGKNHWAQQFIVLAVQQKAINGFDDGTFRPDETVTYEQAVKMVMSYLGYELVAKAKADEAGKPLYPYGYMVIANQYLLTKNAVAIQTEPAKRAISAQLLYNSLNIPRMVQSGLKDGLPVYGFSGGGGGGGGGGSSSTEEKVKGTVVAAYDICIDDDLREEFGNGIGKSIFYIKTTSNKYDDYIELVGNDTEGYKRYIGQVVYVYFDKDTEDIKTLKNITATDETKIEIINSDDIIKDKTTSSRFYYYKNDKEVYINLPEKLTDMKLIYNNKYVLPTPTPNPVQTPTSDWNPTETINELTQTDDVTPTETPVAESTPTPTPTPTPQITADSLFTIEDLMPIQGQVKFIWSEGGGYPDIVMVDSYETWFVGNVDSLGNKEYRITDKYAKINGSLKTVIIDGGDDELSIKKANSSSEFGAESISQLDVLTIAFTKDGKPLEVTDNQGSKLGYIAELPTDSMEGIKIKNVSEPLENSYYFDDYYLPNNDIELAVNDYITYYLDYEGKLVAIKKNPPTLNYGYLIDAKQSSDISSGNGMSLKIYKDTTSGILVLLCTSFKVRTVVNGQDKYIRTSINDVLTMLEDNATAIQSVKPDSITKYNNKYAQLIRYDYNTYNKEITLDLCVPSTMYTASSDIVRYSTSTSKFVELNKKFNSNIVVYSVPNNSQKDSAYKKLTSLTDGIYNVEVYDKVFVDTSGNDTIETGAIILYNEDIDMEPSVYSSAIIINSSSQTGGGDSSTSTMYTGFGIGGYYASANDTTNAQWWKINETNLTNETKLKVGKYDVTWYGKTYDNKMGKQKVLFDVETDKDNYYVKAYNKKSIEITDSEPFMRIMLGNVLRKPSNANDYIRVDTNGDGVYNSNDNDRQLDLGSCSICMYDSTDNTAKVVNCTYKDINVGDKVFAMEKLVNNELQLVMLYIVKYPAE